MCELLCKTARVTKTPSDGRGVFSFTIAAFDTVDSDREIIANYKNVGENSKTVVPMDYGHLALLGAGADPLAQKIGSASVSREGKVLHGDAQLDLSNRVAVMVYERLQLPSSDPAFLGAVSVWFSFNRKDVTTDSQGIHTIQDAELLSIAVVKDGAQKTAIDKIKAQFSKACKIGPDGRSLCSPADHFRYRTEHDAGADGQAAADRTARAQRLVNLERDLVWTTVERHTLTSTDGGWVGGGGGDPSALDRKIAALAKEIAALKKVVEADETAQTLEGSAGPPIDSFRARSGIPASDRELALTVETLGVIPSGQSPLVDAVRSLREVKAKVAADSDEKAGYANRGAAQITPKIDRRFRVIQPPAAIPTDPDEVIRGIPLVGVAKGDGEIWKRAPSSR